MRGYFFTEQAERDLEAIIDFTLQHWGAAQTIQYIDGMHEKSQTLANNPELGLARNRLYQGLLSLPHKSHVIFYVKQANAITIVRVLHASLDVSQQF